jgi:hypothetical protein
MIAHRLRRGGFAVTLNKSAVLSLAMALLATITQARADDTLPVFRKDMVIRSRVIPSPTAVASVRDRISITSWGRTMPT